MGYSFVKNEHGFVLMKKSKPIIISKNPDNGTYINFPLHLWALYKQMTGKNFFSDQTYIHSQTETLKPDEIKYISNVVDYLFQKHLPLGTDKEFNEHVRNAGTRYFGTPDLRIILEKDFALLQQRAGQGFSTFTQFNDEAIENLNIAYRTFIREIKSGADIKHISPTYKQLVHFVNLKERR
ncbi:MAG: hypothetical protein ACP5N3_00470 [Candidatus Nanoarchaeia archaeon]